MISLGAIYDGPELNGTAFDRVWMALSRAFSELGKGFHLNVVYCVPGSLGSPDWEGLRDVRFSRKKLILLVHSAVPVEIANSPFVEPIRHFFLQSLHDANHLAFREFHKKGIEFDLAGAEALKP